MLLFYLITFLYGSNSLPVSLLERPQSGDLLTEIKSKVNKTKHNDLLTEIKSNPQQFISEVQNLDPAALRHIIALLEDVLEKSEEREQTLVDDLANKDSALSDANDDVIDAEDTLSDGLSAVELQKIVVGEKQDIVDEAERVLSNEKGVLGDKEHDVAVAESDLNDKKEAHQAKRAEREASKEAHDDEVPDLNDEQQILRDVIDMLQGLHDKQGQAWELAMNIHASDGHDFGYGAPEWNNGNAVGSKDTAHTSDFLDSAVWSTPAASIAIARHQNGLCEAVKVWKLDATRSLQDYFQNERRLVATSGGPVHEYTVDQMAGKSVDPIFGVNGDLALNWWHSNNGARFVLTGGHLSDVGVNDDGTHGLGNEFGADTENFQGSTAWKHDVSIIQSGCHGGSCQVQGSDHGTSLSDGQLYGQYAIFVSRLEESDFQCDGSAMQ